jgi:predicted glycosyltransferase
MLFQIPKILRAIRRERQWLKATQAAHQFDLVISDNRYGLKIDGLASVIMTHQLQIMTGFGPGADFILRKLHYRILQKFDECWVVDEKEGNGLAGALSHPRRIPANAHYIGLLSQMQVPAGAGSAQESRILILLSGPEPMRSLFEDQLLAQIADIGHYHFHIIAGNPAGLPPATLPPHITYTAYANAHELARALADAQLVICRSGYSTLMDLAMFGKKALLVPTPGQSEQEYLALHLQKQGISLSRQQVALDLKKDIAEAMRYNGFQVTENAHKFHRMQQVIDDILNRAKSR